MEMMGYGGQPYIAFKHGDSHNTHIHIVSVCIDGEGSKISDRYEYRRSMAACRELERMFCLRNGAELYDSPKAELRKVDVTANDVRHQVANTLKTVLESYRFQSFGEYNAILSTMNIEARQVKGEYKRGRCLHCHGRYGQAGGRSIQKLALRQTFRRRGAKETDAAAHGRLQGWQVETLRAEAN